MRKTYKWLILCVVGAIAIAFLEIAFIFHRCNNPEVEPIPEAFTNAAVIWDTSSETSDVSIQIEGITIDLEVSAIPTSVTLARYSDEDVARELYSYELYFGATDVRYHRESGMIFIKVSGRNAVCGPRGERIFEFDALQRLPIRDYWISTDK